MIEQAYKRGMIKTAGAGAQLLTSAGTGLLLEKLKPGLGLIVHSGGGMAGLFQDKATAKQIKQLGQGASFAIPGKTSYNLGRRRRYAAGSVSNALKPMLGAGVRLTLGALIGAGVGGAYAPTAADMPKATQKELAARRDAYAYKGAIAGGLLAFSPQIIGWLASWSAKPRTKKQQAQSNESSRFLKGLLLPGYAGYVSNLDARSAQSIADEQLAQQEAKKQQKEQKS